MQDLEYQKMIKIRLDKIHQKALAYAQDEIGSGDADVRKMSHVARKELEWVMQNFLIFPRTSNEKYDNEIKSMGLY